ncbi:MAG: EthD domain-containing protein [Chloroflexi bacterium]|nr:EthD domain-containing protein [Chloroflexota bacterium]
MVKLVSIFSLKPGVDPDEVYKVWREKHTSWVKDKMLPKAKRYTINRLIHKYPLAGGTTAQFDIFGYEMIWFDNLESALRTAERLQSAQPEEFLVKFIKTCKMVIVEGENIKL